MKAWLVIFLSVFLINQPLKALNLTGNYQSISHSVVFVANTENAFDQRFNCDPDSFYEYFRPFYEFFWPPIHSHGTGFLISKDGYIVTAAHVVDDATTTLIAVENPTLHLYNAKLIGSDWRSDIAVLKIESAEGVEFPYLAFGDSDIVEVGDACRLIGSPLAVDFRSSLTEGVISGKDRIFYKNGGIDGHLQTDAPSNFGNSGGPLLNINGEVIGVLRGGMSHYWGFEGMAFAISSNIVQNVVDQLIEYGEISEGYHGISTEEDQESAFDVYFFDNNEGAPISSIVYGSPAEEAGLEEGDVIVEMNDKPIVTTKAFWNQIRLLRPDEEVSLKVLRENEHLDFTFKLTEN